MNSREEVFRNTVATDKDGNRVQVTAPYNFVSLPEFCLPPDWEDFEPDLEIPHREGFSGYMDVSWSADDLPLLVGGYSGEKNSGAPDNSEFYREMLNGAENLALPGSTLRGLIRSTMEAVTGARIVLTDTTARGYSRDFTDTEYKKKILSLADSFGAGWLINDGEADSDRDRPQSFDGWKLLPATADRISHRDIPLRGSEFRGQNARQKYEQLILAKWPGLDTTDDLHFESILELWDHGEGFVYLNDREPDGSKTKSPDGSKTKSKEILLRKSDEKPVKLAAEAIEKLFSNYRWKSNRASGGGSTLDFWWYLFSGSRFSRIKKIPILYYRLPDGEGYLLSTTRIPKLPDEHNLGDLLEGHNRKILKVDGTKPNTLDFVQALFGHVPVNSPEVKANDERSGTDRAWSGRVQFHTAFLSETEDKITTEEITGITGTPSATFHPFYLRDRPDGSGPGDYQSKSSVPRGWKRYPVRGRTLTMPRSSDGDSRLESRMNFIKGLEVSGITFRGRISYRNLKLSELGALVWCIYLGNDPQESSSKLRHSLGRGKAFGYGQIAASITEWNVRPNLRGNSGPSPSEAMQNFTDYAEKTSGGLFSQSTHLKEIQAMANPDIGEKIRDFLVLPTGEGDDDAEATRNGYRTIKSATNSTGLPLYLIDDGSE